VDSGPGDTVIVSRREYDALHEQLAAANARVSELTYEVGRLADLVAQGNDRIIELLAIAQRNKQGSKNTSMVKAPEPPPSLDGEAREAFAKRPAPPKLPKKKKPAKKKTKPTGRKPLPDHLEAEEHTATPNACDCCGCADLELVDEVVEVKLHVVKEHMRKRIVRRKTAC
jgi:hypothetical protein